MCVCTYHSGVEDALGPGALVPNPIGLLDCIVHPVHTYRTTVHDDIADEARRKIQLSRHNQTDYKEVLGILSREFLARLLRFPPSH